MIIHTFTHAHTYTNTTTHRYDSLDDIVDGIHEAGTTIGHRSGDPLMMRLYTWMAQKRLRLQEVFRKYDSDASGYFEPGELLELLNELGRHD